MTLGSLLTVLWLVWLTVSAAPCGPLRRLLRQIELSDVPPRETWVCLRAHLRGQQVSLTSTTTGDRLLKDMGEAGTPGPHLARLARLYDAELERLQQRHVEGLKMPDGAARLVAQYHLTQTLRHSPYLLREEREPADDASVRSAWRMEVLMRRFLREPDFVTDETLQRLAEIAPDSSPVGDALRRYEAHKTPRLLRALKEAWTRHERDS